MGDPDTSARSPGSARASDDAVLASVTATLRDVVLPSLDDAWATAATIQLIGLVDNLRTRGDDRAAAHRQELTRTLDRIAANEIVRRAGRADPYSAASAALVAAVGRDDDAADEVRRELRPLLVRHLDEDLAESSPMIEAFPRTAATMTDQIARWLEEELGLCGPVSISRIGTGHSRAMYVAAAADGRRVVVRVEQGGVFGTSGVEECRVIRALHASGFPVAAILGEESTGTVVGNPFFVMEFLAGAEGADERAVDEETAASFVRELHRLHKVDGSDDPFDLVPPTPSDATPMQIDRWQRVCRAASVRPIPLLDEAAEWLRRNAPPLDRTAVVHGDAGPGNFVHAGGHVVAVTDWEFAHLGDPTEDWAFCLTIRGARTMPRERWLALFAEHAGFTMDDRGWRYWEAFNLFKGTSANRTCLAVFEDGRNRAPNMAIIGTALHQTFLRRLCDIVGT